MKLSASKWLALLGVLSTRDGSGVRKRTWTTSTQTLVPVTSAIPVVVTTIPVWVTVSTPVYATTTEFVVISAPMPDTTTPSLPVTMMTSVSHDATPPSSAITTPSGTYTIATSIPDTAIAPVSATATTPDSSATGPAASTTSVSNTSSVSATSAESPTNQSSATIPVPVTISSATTSDYGTVPSSATINSDAPTNSLSATTFVPATASVPATSPGAATSSSDAAITASQELFPAPIGAFTLPPGSQTLVISVGTAIVQAVGSMTTYLTTLTNTALYLETEGPVVSYSEVLKMPGATLYIEGDPSMVVSQTATATTTASVLTSMRCTESVCSPKPTAMSYTCGIVDGSTQSLTTIMQSYRCTTGQLCEGAPVETILTCGCGGPICTTVLPLIPLASVIIPIGAPLPPKIPEPPAVPKPPTFPWPPVLPKPPTFPKPPTDPTPPTVPEPTPGPEPSVPEPSNNEDSTSSGTSTSSTTSSSSSSSSTSACSYGEFSIPDDLESTLSAWMSQHPIVLTPYTSMTTQTDSSNILASSTSTVSSSSSFNTPTSSSTSLTPPSPTAMPTPAPSLTAITMSTSTSLGCDAACSSSSASSAFEAGLSRSMAAGHSSATRAFASATSAQSASIASVSSASVSSAQAISTCQHYTPELPWNPPDINVSLGPHTGNSHDGSWTCVTDPTRIDVRQDWNATWKYQPFATNRSWDRDHPNDNLMDTFCEYLANQSVDITPDGDVQGVCQTYNQGKCHIMTEAELMNSCWEHGETTLFIGDSVVISVSYDKDCTVNGKSEPVDFGKVGPVHCMKPLYTLAEKCSIPPGMRKSWAKDYYEVGGSIRSNCMIYTMVGIQKSDVPDPIWHT